MTPTTLPGIDEIRPVIATMLRSDLTDGELVGIVMRKFDGKANPSHVFDVVRELRREKAL